jgi:hypothetical protein
VGKHTADVLSSAGEFKKEGSSQHPEGPVTGLQNCWLANNLIWRFMVDALNEKQEDNTRLAHVRDLEDTLPCIRDRSLSGRMARQLLRIGQTCLQKLSRCKAHRSGQTYGNRTFRTHLMSTLMCRYFKNYKSSP